ncbi:Flp pilus assembly protein CpaB [Pelagibacterium halotolerans]|uniref:Flp pilus assembly protein RcpC/CpaB n=1 Tax=Pelagibacterium halotolerans (strain DSM 22347 / JCM 15775 / CGMCC 1.7692 / B2) TaxID=1082931 RepID=G4RFS2_PELHB|nr:Flp pilus assembly protein CpaB [Pelagibacterium halotolerans]AEQ50086.1 Flp pilus assembly protein RcpC/CpaB [Pelagibacterium halotolerans B2]QJR19897.1 Flp pilus assembly protein CpaB [Pelagibacterium halotolerans]SEA47609.1 pilus assembly protein CpaB [Pelagibacterium halotolerans]
MKPARILLIVVAIVAGGLAAFLATRGNSPRPQETQSAAVEVQREARAQILVATRAIGLGQRLTEADVGWQDWPEGAVRSEFITAGTIPDAPQQVAGSVARFEFFPGEPIREAKLVNSTQGYLSAVIGQGMRAVSISVNPDSASGGYIVPNDRVDIVLTRSGGDYSETILSNVRVLAIGTRLGEVGTTGGQADPENPSSQVFESAEIATLELTPAQAETILQSGSMGRLTLVLRSVVDFAQTTADEDGGSQTVKLIRYGQSQSVTSSAPRRAPSSGTSVSALENPAAPLAPAQPSSPVIEVR